jgi:hypothetical protein
MLLEAFRSLHYLLQAIEVEILRQSIKNCNEAGMAIRSFDGVFCALALSKSFVLFARAELKINNIEIKKRIIFFIKISLG